MPRDPVVDEALAETYDFDIRRASFPNLPLGQNSQPSTVLLRLDLHLMRTDTGSAKLFQKEVLHFCNSCPPSSGEATGRDREKRFLAGIAPPMPQGGLLITAVSAL